jgi:hypothetical protein
MKHTGKGHPAMNPSSKPSGNALGDCLRAAEADANRFHGVQAPKPWQHGGRLHKGKVLVAGLALLATAATLLALQPGTEDAPPVTVAKAPPPDHPWFTTVRSDEPADTAPVPDAPAGIAPAISPAANATPAAIADTASLVALDGGDQDVAATMPASVLTAPLDGHEAPRIAPMNVPTVPDDGDSATGEPDLVPDVPLAGS